MRALYLSVLFLCFSFSSHCSPLRIKITSPYACLIDATTGEVLFEKNAYDPIFPASVTKIATAIHVLDQMGYDPDLMIRCHPESVRYTNEKKKKAANYTLPPYWLEPDGDGIGLVGQEVVSYHDLLHSLLISSANDSANVLAHYCGESIPKFMDGVNSWAKEIGCLKTNLLNPSGLHHPEHMSCAYDTALMAREGLKIPLFAKLVRMEKFSQRRSIGDIELKQTNRLVRQDQPYFYPYAIGVKTGTTKLAKLNLVAAADNGDRKLILSVHKSPSRESLYADIIHIFDTAFAEKKECRTLFRADEMIFSTQVENHPEKLKAIMEKDIVWAYYPSEEREIEAVIEWDSHDLPINSGQRVGNIVVNTLDGRKLFEEPIYAINDLSKSVMDRMKEQIINLHLIWYILGGVFALFIVLRLVGRERSS